MKLQHIAVIFVIVIVPITFVLSTYINTQMKTIRYTSKYDAFLIDASYDALKAYQLNSFNNNISSISNSKIRDIEASIKVYFDTLASDFKSVGYTYDQMVANTPAILFSLYDGYYIYTKNFDVEKNFQAHNIDNLTQDEIERKTDRRENNSSYEYGLKPFVYYSCRYVEGNDSDFVVNYTLDNRISIIGKVDGENVVVSGPLLWCDFNEDGNITDSDKSAMLDYLNNNKEYLSDNLLIVSREGDNLKATTGQYEYVIYGNEKVYLNYDWLHEKDNTNKNKTKNPTERNNLFFRYNEEYTKSFVNTSQDLENLCKLVTDYGHLYSDNRKEYIEEAVFFTDWCNIHLEKIRQSDAVDVNGEPLVGGDVDDYYCNFVTDIGDEPIFVINKDNNPLVKGSAFNEHRISVIRYSIENNLSSAMASYVNTANVGYEYTMPVFTENDWNKIENNVCISTFLQGMPVGSEVYNKYFVLSNNENQDAVDIDSIYVLVRNDNDEVEYHKPGCLELIDYVAENGTDCILGIYQTSDFKRRKISVSGEDVNALNQLNGTEGVNFNYYYLHSWVVDQAGQKVKVKGACYDCIVNVSTAFSAETLITERYYDYAEHEYRKLEDYIDDSSKYNNVKKYLQYYKASLYRIRQNAYMINGYFGIEDIFP